MRADADLIDADAYELRDFVEHILAPLHWVGPDGTILWANRAELEFLGYARDEYIGRHIADFHADRTVIEDILARLSRDETLRNYPARMRHKDGSTRDVLISSSVLWRDRQFLHTRCLTIDVTDRMRAEAERARAERTLTTQYAVTHVLADAATVEEAAPLILEALGDVCGWTIGALWRISDAEQLMRCVDVWSAPGAGMAEFERVTREMTFAEGAGMPGRVWATGAPAWIENVTEEPDFPRAPYAAAAGLCAGVGFPIRIGARTTGILEFFSREPRRPDPELMRLLDAIGTQIGQFAERRQMEIVRARLAAIVDSSEDVIISKTFDGVITSWNRGAERILGYTAQEAIGRHVSLIVPPERHAEEEDVLARLRGGGRIDHFETERRAKDGRRLPISLTVSPIHDAAGRPVGVSSVARDITQRRRAEESLRRSERQAQTQAALMRAINRVGAEVIASLDRDSIVQKVTDLGTELTAAEFGAFFHNVVDDDSGEAFMLYALSGAPREAFAGFPKPRATAIFGPTFRGEGTIRLDDVTKDPRYGQNAPYHGMPAGHLPVRSYLAVPVRGRSGDVLGGLFFGHSDPGVFTDTHEQLAEGVATWASMALENAALYEDAEQAVRARDDFLSVVSHELRNPLNALQLQMVGLHRAAQESTGPLSPVWVSNRIGEATEDVSRLVRLVHDLLDFSQITAGRVDLEPEPMELSGLVRAIVARFEAEIGDRTVTIDAAPVHGHWDRLRVDQIVTNLLSNAIKYGAGKPIEISLRDEGDAACLRVTDHGIGIEPADQARLFRRFERAVSRRQVGGFGLGLWITRRLVDAMGGRIDVDSHLGHGSTFTVTLPRAQPPAPPTP